MATLVRTKPTKPTDVHVETMRVVATERVGRSFVRVRLAGADAAFDAGFRYRGDDQWFRLFLPNERGGLHLPRGGVDGWYARWLVMSPSTKPHVRNYTVRHARRGPDGWEIDVDMVVHESPGGTVDGVAASWALGARPGDRVGLLDQGTLFSAADRDRAAAAAAPVWMVADETGLPGVEAVARTLPAGVRVSFLLEVPHADDRREIVTDADADVVWVVRGESGELPGRALVRRLTDVTFDPEGYVYVVGEASMALDVRAAAQAVGMRKEHVDFCAYWRPERRRRR